MGSLRRSALRASRLRVSSFSSASSRRLASSHSSRDTTSGRLITKPPRNGVGLRPFGGTTNRPDGNGRCRAENFSKSEWSGPDEAGDGLGGFLDLVAGFRAALFDGLGD